MTTIGRRMGHLNSSKIMLLAALIGSLAFGANAQRVRESFDAGWRFARFGEQADGSRIDEPAGLETATLDDSGWRGLDLPHDWGIEGPFRQELPGHTGKLPWRGIGWYRKTFEVSAEDEQRRIFIDFDGAMANSKVWLNGQYIGEWPYGYTPFQLELTGHVKFGEKNVLAVRLDTENWGSRWYPGAGIYRHVWLTRTHPIHIEKWGVQITTPDIAEGGGHVAVSASLKNASSESCDVSLRASFFEYGTNAAVGAKVVQVDHVDLSLRESGQHVAEFSTEVPAPKRWELDEPQRYICRIEVLKDGECIDVYEQPFGFRSLEFTAKNGFWLNGKKVAVQGVCMHNDLGPLGTAFNERAFERQMRIMKEMGVNAIRTSHHAPAPQVLEICDRLGLLVQVESFDCWRKGKTANDYGQFFDQWHERDLAATVLMGRNHPSVFMWCLGNEIMEKRGELIPVGIELAARLGAVVKQYDRTRPTTVGMNSGKMAYTGFQKSLDVFGFNYQISHYPQFHQHTGNEELIYHGSETSSCLSSRGEYFFPVFSEFKEYSSAGSGNPKHAKAGLKEKGYVTAQDFQISSYDVAAPKWGCTPDYQFMTMDQNPACFGEFVWTGFDYIGEPTPYNADVSNLFNFTDPAKIAELKKELDEVGKISPPSRSSYFGIVDLCGFRKDRFYLYQSRWRPELPMAHILPHWNWPDRVGKVTPVHVYTSGDEGELLLNGKSLGRKKKGPFEYRLMWNNVVYTPGTLKVVVYRDGKKWAEDEVATSGKASRLKLAADRTSIDADGQDFVFVSASVLDSDGRLVPRSSNKIKFTVEGPGEIVATGTGDPTNQESFGSTQRNAFNGRCLAIVRAKPGQSGTIRVRAQAKGLDSTLLNLTLRSRNQKKINTKDSRVHKAPPSDCFELRVEKIPHKMGLG